MREGRTKAGAATPPPTGGGADDEHCPGGKHEGGAELAGGELVDGDFVGWVGCVGCVDGGALVLGADEDGRTVWCVAGGRVGAGEWSVCFGGTLAGGGNCSTGTPSMSAFITAVHVAVG